MRIDTENWARGKDFEFNFDAKTAVRFTVAGAAPIVVSVDGIPVWSGSYGSQRLVFSGLLTFSSKSEFGLSAGFRDAQSGEPFDEKEVVALAVSGNMLGRIRQSAAREAHRQRNAVMELAGWSSEIEEGDERFEEEIFEQARSAAGSGSTEPVDDPATQPPMDGKSPPHGGSEPLSDGS